MSILNFIPSDLYRNLYLRKDNGLFFYSMTTEKEQLKTKWEITEKKELEFYIKGHVDINAIFKSAFIMSNHDILLYKFKENHSIQLQELFPDDSNLMHFYNIDITFSMAMKMTNKYYPNTYIEVSPNSFEDYTLVKMTMRADTIILMYKLIDMLGGFLEFEHKTHKTQFSSEGLWNKSWNSKNTKADLFSIEKSQFFYNLKPISYEDILAMYDPQVIVKNNDVVGFYQFDTEELKDIYSFFETERQKKEISAHIEYISDLQKNETLGINQNNIESDNQFKV